MKSKKKEKSIPDSPWKRALILPLQLMETRELKPGTTPQQPQEARAAKPGLLAPQGCDQGPRPVVTNSWCHQGRSRAPVTPGLARVGGARMAGPRPRTGE